MLLDNKTRSNENRHFRVFDLLSNYVETGRGAKKKTAAEYLKNLEKTGILTGKCYT